MIRISLLASLLTVSCAQSQHPVSANAEVDPGIAGEIRLEREQDTLRGCRTPNFDAERTLAHADNAATDGRHDEAFDAYLAVCDDRHPIACIRAVELLERDILTHSVLSEHKDRFIEVILNTAAQGRVETTCNLVTSKLMSPDSR